VSGALIASAFAANRRERQRGPHRLGGCRKAHGQLCSLGQQYLCPADGEIIATNKLVLATSSYRSEPFKGFPGPRVARSSFIGGDDQNRATSRTIVEPDQRQQGALDQREGTMLLDLIIQPVVDSAASRSPACHPARPPTLTEREISVLAAPAPTTR